MTLGDYLKAAAARPWRWGVDDCCTYVAGWAMALGRPDPMGELRGAYDDEDGAVALIRRAGGLGALLDARLTGAGLRRVRRRDARLGDIGCLDTLNQAGTRGAIAAIRSEARWVFFSGAGLVALAPDMAKVRGVWRG